MFLLDTNTASSIIRRNSKKLIAKLSRTEMSELAISSITEAELLYGLARKPGATQLQKDVEAVLIRLRRLPWTSSTAAAYGTLRYISESKGISVGTMDLLIAAHARETDRVLVTNDRALHRLKPWLEVEDWT